MYICKSMRIVFSCQLYRVLTEYSRSNFAVFKQSFTKINFLTHTECSDLLRQLSVSEKKQTFERSGVLYCVLISVKKILVLKLNFVVRIGILRVYFGSNGSWNFLMLAADVGFLREYISCFLSYVILLFTLFLCVCFVRFVCVCMKYRRCALVEFADSLLRICSTKYKYLGTHIFLMIVGNVL